jgi:nuclear pore complex protein Nup93
MGASQPQQPGGLFASMSASQPQKSGGLFASMGASQPQQPGGLFASMGASQPQQPGGLFASMGASQPQQPGGLFAIMAASQSAVQQSQQQGGQHAPKQSAYFEQMVERGKKRNNMENGGLGELPRLQLGLADIARKARNLGTGGPSAAEARADDTRA